MFEAQIWKAPNVAQANGVANASHQEIPSTGPLLSLFKGSYWLHQGSCVGNANLGDNSPTSDSNLSTEITDSVDEIFTPKINVLADVLSIHDWFFWDDFDSMFLIKVID